MTEHFSRSCQIKGTLGHFSLCKVKEPLDFFDLLFLFKKIIIVYDDVK